ncbi:MAG TPA: BTAD domain-containing putative transcriptional regulator [Streptosporangiaceae bacterium]|nr:BTAD domain-containing putative transcriptional regulator [Streptosporangiaceae bacterium]
MTLEPRFGLLGSLLVRRGEAATAIPAGKQRVLLAALLLSPGRALPADELADLLWEAGPPPSARGTVHNYVKRLRQALDDADRTLLITQADGYLLRVSPDDVDIARFEIMVAGALQVLQAGRCEQAARELRDALSLWRGRPLADVPCDRLVVRHVPRLEELRWQALEARIEADLGCGRPSDVLPELRALVAAEPLRERLHGLLMLALYGGGRQSDALAAFRDARRVLIDEVGVEPGPGLQRLHQQILDGDPALRAATVAAAPSAPPVVPRQLPGAMAHFVGRVPELSRLDAVAAAAGGSCGAAAIVVLSGTAGVGKTALALQWAHRCAGRFPDGQLYVNLRGFGPEDAPRTPADGLADFVEALQPSARIPGGLDARAGLYRSLTAGKRLLVILDNARDADQVRPLLPGSAGCMALITSRDRLAGLAVSDGAVLLTLDALPEPEARALVVARAGEGRAAAQPGAVAQITTLCGRLPLALAIASARAAARPGLPMAELAAELRDARDRLDALDAGEPASSARAVLSWSYRSLSPSAARLFRLLGLHPGPDIGVGAAASLAGVSPGRGRGMLGELTRLHIAAEPTAGRFGLHDLLRAYALERAEADETAADRHAAVHRLLDYYLHTAHAMSRVLSPPRDAITLAPPQPGVLREELGGYRQAWSWAETEYPVLLAMVALAADAGFARHAWQLARALDAFLARRGRWPELAHVQRLALGAAHQAGDLTGQAHAHCGIGWTCVSQGSYDDGRTHLREAAELFRQVGDKTGEARACVRTGQAFWREGSLGEACRYAERALELYRAAGDRVGEAGALNNIGLYHLRLGAYERGLDCCRRALAAFRELGHQRGEANALDSLGDGYHRVGRAGDAIACYQESLAAFRELGDRNNQAEILTHLAAAYQASGDAPLARQCLEQALAILTELQHRNAAEVRARLADLAAEPASHAPATCRWAPPAGSAYPTAMISPSR